MRKLTALLAAASLSACASTTIINTLPPGALVTVDGVPRGPSPVAYTDPSTWDWSSHQVVAQLPGYQPTAGQISASQINVGRLIVGLALCTPLLLAATDYQPGYTFALAPLYPPQGPPAGYPPSGYPPPGYHSSAAARSVVPSM